MLGQLDKNTHGRTNTQGLWMTEWKASAAFFKDICKRLDFLVLLDKDDKP